MSLTPQEAMALAIEEGKKGVGFVSPNPLVGCVILDRDLNLIGKGYHAQVGQAHAEIQALNSVENKSALEGAHVYVTLEPCAHEGRTPSCAKALARLPIQSVIYGLKDPNPRVSGQGAEILRQAGKSVSLFGELQFELERLCEIYLTNAQKQRPFVALKVGASLDGKIAWPDGHSQWITGEKSREHVQYLRGCYDAVLVGAGTFLQDNPRLNSRDPRFVKRPQRVVLLDPQGRCFPRLEDSALAKARPPEEIFIVTSALQKTRLPVRQVILPMDQGSFNLSELLRALITENIYSVFVEGGAFTYAGFIKQNLADRLYLFMAPKLLGEGLSWTSGLGSHCAEFSQELSRAAAKKYGDDLLISGLFGAPIAAKDS